MLALNGPESGRGLSCHWWMRCECGNLNYLFSRLENYTKVQLFARLGGRKGWQRGQGKILSSTRGSTTISFTNYGGFWLQKSKWRHRLMSCTNLFVDSEIFFNKVFHPLVWKVSSLLWIVVHWYFSMPMRKLPLFGGEEIDLYLLYKTVTDLGGWLKVLKFLFCISFSCFRVEIENFSGQFAWLGMCNLTNLGDRWKEMAWSCQVF